MRAAVVIACTGLAMACSGLIGIPGEETRALPDGGGSDDATNAIESGHESCPASTETDECFRCTDEACCVEYAACHDEPRCGDYFQTCLPQCEASGESYDACVVQCDASQHAGHVRFAPYNACAETHCAGPCGKGKVADACTSCAIASCLDTYTACLADADCDTLTACVEGCKGSSACADGCRANKSQAAGSEADQLFACWAIYCKDACATP